MLLSIVGLDQRVLGVFGTVAGAVAVRRAADRVRRGAADRLGDRRALLPRAQAEATAAAQPRSCVLHLRERVRAADMALCPAYSGRSARCAARSSRAATISASRMRASPRSCWRFARQVLPARVAAALNTRGGPFRRDSDLLQSGHRPAAVLHLPSLQRSFAPAARDSVETTLWLVFLSLLVLSGIGAWLIVLAHESRRAAEAESARQTAMLMEEIEAHGRTDAALQRAKEVAEAANLAKTRYIVGFSHEIRTPLNSIFGYAQLLERGCAGADKPVRVIRRSAEHLSNLIDGLLDVSKIENGMLQLNRDTVQLPEFLDQLVDMFRLQAMAKGLDFHYQRPPHLPLHVHTDQKRLRQILINLLSNAIKYTERGSVTASRALPQPDRRVRSRGHRARHCGGGPGAHLRALRARQQPGACAPCRARVGADDHQAADADHGR
jgi:signal transduction histidine kinase